MTVHGRAAKDVLVVSLRTRLHIVAHKMAAYIRRAIPIFTTQLPSLVGGYSRTCKTALPSCLALFSQGAVPARSYCHHR